VRGWKAPWERRRPRQQGRKADEDVGVPRKSRRVIQSVSMRVCGAVGVDRTRFCAWEVIFAISVLGMAVREAVSSRGVERVENVACPVFAVQS